MSSTPQTKIIASATADLGKVSLRTEPGRVSGRIVLVNDIGQSYVDVEDPTFLAFDYVKWIAAVADSCGTPGGPLRVLHLGGGGMTLPRYLAAVRPGSPQVIVEADAGLFEFVTSHMPLPEEADMTIHIADARSVIETLPDDEFDLVINDAYDIARMPANIAGEQFAAHAARVLGPEGVYTVNVTDQEKLKMTLLQSATLTTAFTEVCVVSAHTSLDNRRFINAVVAATNRPEGLPVDQINAAGVRHGTSLAMVGGEEFYNALSRIPPLPGLEPLKTMAVGVGNALSSTAFRPIPTW